MGSNPLQCEYRQFVEIHYVEFESLIGAVV